MNASIWQLALYLFLSRYPCRFLFFFVFQVGYLELKTTEIRDPPVHRLLRVSSLEASDMSWRYNLTSKGRVYTQ